jgi:D-glycero-D-manno-heptose 1,7-bisphosphate phosphatase
LLRQAAQALNLDLSASLMIGDAVTDVQAGHAAGTRALLVRTGRGADQVAELARSGLTQVPVAADLAAALADFTASPPRA